MVLGLLLAGCEKDTDCKGDRVCEAGRCVAPQAASQAAVALLVPAPLETRGVGKFDGELKTVFFQTLRERGGVLTPMKAEVEAAYVGIKRQDCRESNECLTLLAGKAGTLYALFAEVGYSEQKVVSVTARVVRDDGKVMGSANVSEAKGKDTIVEVAKRLFLKAYEELALANLPTFKEVKTEPAKVEPVKKDPDPIVVKDFPPPPPPLPPVDVDAGKRGAGQVLVAAGAGVAVVGGVLLGAGCGLGCGVPVTPGGSVAPSDLERAVTGRGLMTAGIVTAVVGAGTAVVGALLWGTSKPAPSAALVPVNGGVVVQWGGSF